MKKNGTVLIAIAAAIAFGLTSTGATAATHPVADRQVAKSASAFAAAPANAHTSGVPSAAPAAATPKVATPATRTSAAEPRVIPLVIRAAVKVALAYIKRTSVKTYRALIAAVKKGKTEFINWYEKTAPAWVKVAMPGFALSKIWDALVWLLGL